MIESTIKEIGNMDPSERRKYMIELQKSKGNAEVEIAKDGCTIHEHDDVATISYEDVYESKINEKLILLFLNAIPKKRDWCPVVVSKAMGISINTFKTTLTKLVREGKVNKNGIRGNFYYEIVNDKLICGKFKLYYKISDLYIKFSGKERLVFIYLKSFGKRNNITSKFICGHRYFRCCNTLISEDLGMSTPTINDAIKKLKKAALIDIISYNEGSKANQRWIFTK